jgi:hypothetical protein
MHKNMKKISFILAAFTMLVTIASCDKELAVKNVNNQTTYDFGNTDADLQEAVIACYNRIRLEGTFARVGYMHDVMRGDEAWNPQNAWYIPADHLNSPGTIDVTDQWIWRDSYHVVNRCNFVLKKIIPEENNMTPARARMRGEALFLRALAYYQLATYYQTVPKFDDYAQYGSLETIYSENVSQDEILDLVESDLLEAMELLPKRDIGGEWAKGRATCGAAAGYYARTLMFRHKYEDALKILKDLLNTADGGTEKYGHYELVADYGANFREGVDENNAESLFEVQFMDYGTGGVDEEWTPVNISSNATQGHALEANMGPGTFGGWGDVAMSNWLYNLFKAEKCTDGRLDPRLYWTAMTYEPEYDLYTGNATAAYPGGDPRANVVYQEVITNETQGKLRTNNDNGGIPVSKWTNARTGLYASVVTGLHCGINLRLMRYADVLLRAAECENEVNGPTQQAIDWINAVRGRVALAPLSLATFAGNADKLFEQIANVERPKEFGLENGRGVDLIRWGFFYNPERLQQIAAHSRYYFDDKYDEAVMKPITTDNLNPKGSGTPLDCTDDSYTSYFREGHEYFPIFQGTLNNNPKLHGNSANTSTPNTPAWRIHPVTDLN